MATKLLHSLFGVFWLIFVPTLIFVANIQIIFLLPVLFISRRLFRRAAGLVGDLLWPGLAWSFEVFNNNPIKFYGEELPYGESTLVLANHSFHCDFIVVFALAFRCRMLGMYRMVLKNAIRYIPAVGTALGAMGFVYLSRSWTNDSQSLRRMFSGIKNVTEPFWLVSHPEGTRLTSKKLVESNEFAQSKGLSETKYVLQPRVKGFVSSVLALHDRTDAIYDLTIGYQNPPASFLGIIAGFGNRPTSVHVYIRRFTIDTVPTDPDEVEKWIYARYAEKDKLLQQFHDNGSHIVEIELHLEPKPKKYTGIQHQRH